MRDVECDLLSFAQVWEALAGLSPNSLVCLAHWSETGRSVLRADDLASCAIVPTLRYGIPYAVMIHDRAWCRVICRTDFTMAFALSRTAAVHVMMEGNRHLELQFEPASYDRIARRLGIRTVEAAYRSFPRVGRRAAATMRGHEKENPLVRFH